MGSNGGGTAGPTRSPRRHRGHRRRTGRHPSSRSESRSRPPWREDVLTRAKEPASVRAYLLECTSAAADPFWDAIGDHLAAVKQAAEGRRGSGPRAARVQHQRGLRHPSGGASSRGRTETHPARRQPASSGTATQRARRSSTGWSGAPEPHRVIPGPPNREGSPTAQPLVTVVHSPRRKSPAHPSLPARPLPRPGRGSPGPRVAWWPGRRMTRKSAASALAGLIPARASVSFPSRSLCGGPPPCPRPRRP
jgi:hypothetical protein